MSEEVVAIKERGTFCLKNQKYEEAVLHYSHAIKMDPKNYSLFSNRSLAFLKMQQYYLAFEDAQETIRLKPDWAKGYFRKAEVEFHTSNFNDALLSYKLALTLQPNDPSLEEAIKKTKAALKKDKVSDEQIPWIGAAIGIFIGAVIVIADQIFTYKPILGNPIIMVFITLAIATISYFVANKLWHYIKSQRKSLLEPPVNLYEDKKPYKEENLEKMKNLKLHIPKLRADRGLRKVDLRNWKE